MKTIKLSELFEVRYGDSLELNALEKTTKENGIAFVSRSSMSNNGVSGYVKPIKSLDPAPAGDISCALGGTVLTTCLQNREFYSGYHVAILRPKTTLSQIEKLAYCTFITKNRFRYNYGRQANKTLRDLMLPDLDYVRKIAGRFSIPSMPSTKPACDVKVSLSDRNWVNFQYCDVFEVTGSKTTPPLDIEDMPEGRYPYVTTSAVNNGISRFYNAYTDNGGCLTVDSAVNGYCAYQEENFLASDHVEKLIPKSFKMNAYTAMFLVSILNQERYRYNYGRKPSQTRLETALIKLPVDEQGEPDWQFMEDYIKSLPCSANLMKNTLSQQITS